MVHIASANIEVVHAPVIEGFLSGYKKMNPGLDTNKKELEELRADLKDLSSSLKKSAEANSKLGSIMFVLAMVQTLIAILQTLLSSIYPTESLGHEVFGIFVAIAGVAMLVYFFNLLDRPNKK
jgi:hypothetical protein